MPFNELQRRDSWPPTIVRIRDTHNPRTDTFEPTKLDIDENPFSYFLTSPEDLDELDNEDLSAGIESSSTPKPVVREVSPSSLQRISLPLPSDSEEESEEEFGLEMPLTLKDFTQKFRSYTPYKPWDGRKSRTGKHHGVTGLGIMIPENASFRGRAKVRLTPRGRGRARSLSARKPQSWRLPSPDIYAIEEENEDEEKVARATTPDIVVTTPTETHIHHLAPPAPKPKPKKRVHWAI